MGVEVTRKFTHSEAKRDAVPLLIGLAGPSGGGKTLSALKLAVGIQRVAPGPIFVIDTESRRATHYAWDEDSQTGYKFTHVPFDPPYGPDAYLDAFKHCVAHGAKTVVVDSFSHEHEGEGGVLEMHEKELKRMGGGEKNNFRAWGKPKRARQKLKTAMIGMPCTFILCFRAKEKTKPGKDEKTGKSTLVDMGWIPIGGQEYLFEMTMRALLPSNADGVPVFSPERRGESLVYKCPQYFQPIFSNSHALCEADGEAMARWAAGGKPAPCFNDRLMWEGKVKWGGKPLAAADSEALQLYGSAVELAMGKTKGAKAERMASHLDDIRQAMKGTK